MSVAIIGGAFLRIAQDAIRFGRFLEILLGRMIVGIAIRMILHRHLLIGAFERGRVAIAADAEDFVIIALGGVHFLVTATFTMAGRDRKSTRLNSSHVE